MIRFDAGEDLLAGGITLDLSERSTVLEADFGLIQTLTAVETPYEGEYEVTPTVEGFILPTRKKTMREDLTVKQIPIYATGNTAGGETVYIAGKLEE